MFGDFVVGKRTSIVLVKLSLVVVFSSLGQLSFKVGVTSLEMPDQLVVLPLTIVRSPALLLTGGVYAVALVLYADVLSSVRLSIAYPLIGSTYILVVLGSVYLLGESITDITKVGVVLIAIGVGLVGLGLEL